MSTFGIHFITKLTQVPFKPLSFSVDVKPMLSSACSSSCFGVSSSSFYASSSTISFNFSHPYSLLSTILLHKKEAVSHTPSSLSANAYGVAIRFLIQPVIFIIGFLVEYSLFVDNFRHSFIYTKKRSNQHQHKGNFPYSSLLCSALLCLAFIESVYC